MPAPDGSNGRLRRAMVARDRSVLRCSAATNLGFLASSLAHSSSSHPTERLSALATQASSTYLWTDSGHHLAGRRSNPQRRRCRTKLTFTNLVWLNTTRASQVCTYPYDALYDFLIHASYKVLHLQHLTSKFLSRRALQTVIDNLTCNPVILRPLNFAFARRADFIGIAVKG